MMGTLQLYNLNFPRFLVPCYFILRLISNQIQLPILFLGMIPGFQGTIPGFQGAIPVFHKTRDI